MDKRDIINMVYTIPYRIGHKVGFTKLNELNNQWILEMIKGEGDYTLSKPTERVTRPLVVHWL